jgi:hypothetical protein
MPRTTPDHRATGPSLQRPDRLLDERDEIHAVTFGTGRRFGRCRPIGTVIKTPELREGQLTLGIVAVLEQLAVMGAELVDARGAHVQPLLSSGAVARRAALPPWAGARVGADK